MISLQTAPVRRSGSAPATTISLPAAMRPSERLTSYRFDLDTDDPVDGYTKLIPADLLVALQREVEALLRPAHKGALTNDELDHL